MKGSKVASRYAKALLDLSIEQNVDGKVQDDMSQLVHLCEESRDLENLINSPIVDRRKKLEIFKTLFEGKMDKVSMSFMNLIIKNSREDLLPAIATSYVSLYKRHKGIVEVHLTSAAPLEKAAKDKILAKIKGIVDGEIELHESVDPELIGGFVVRIDDKQVDASIASQLTNLKNILLN